MTIWTPTLVTEGPRYLAIAEAIAFAIEGGELGPGERLPPQRDLADELGVTTGTITRAYSEAARRGLVRGEVGRGTFVSTLGIDELELMDRSEPDDVIQLGLSFACLPQGAGEALTVALRRIADCSCISELLRYQPSQGCPRHRRAGAAWLAQGGIEAEADRVLVCVGGQHALGVALAAVCRPGDLVLCEDLVYAGFKAIARQQQVRLEGLPMDGAGILPDALDTACRGALKPKALYLIPTLQNPTNAIMTPERRREIVEISRLHDLAIIEDDACGALVDERLASLAELAPERTYHVASLSKTVAPGLRVAYLLPPEGAVEACTAALRSTTWMAPPLMVEIATTWIEDGTARRLVRAEQAELRARQEIVAELFEGWDLATHPTAPNAWLCLPEPWRSEELAAAARDRGVVVAPCSAFVVGRSLSPHAVRLSLGPPRTRDQLRLGLSIVRELAEQSPPPGRCIV